MTFYCYTQNNSGGSFDYDGDKGITHHVIIEASDREEARKRALDIGLYFDGCESGRDCDCCGDRWYDSDWDKGTTEPTIYGEPVKEKAAECMWRNDFPKGSAAVHYKHGRVKWF